VPDTNCWEMSSADDIPLPFKAIVVKKPWAAMLVSGEKVWELRGKRTGHRGRVAIAESGTGALIGECVLIDCKPVGHRGPGEALVPPQLHPENFLGLPQNVDRRRVNNFNEVPYHQVWAYVMSKPIKYVYPIPYARPRGAVTWVKLASTGLQTDTSKTTRKAPTVKTALPKTSKQK